MYESTFAASDVVTVPAKLASSPRAAASSLRVSSAPGAPSITAVTSAIASDFAVAIAVTVAVDTGLSASEVLSTFPRPSVVAVTAETSERSASCAVSAIP